VNTFSPSSEPPDEQSGSQPVDGSTKDPAEWNIQSSIMQAYFDLRQSGPVEKMGTYKESVYDHIEGDKVVKIDKPIVQMLRRYLTTIAAKKVQKARPKHNQEDFDGVFSEVISIEIDPEVIEVGVGPDGGTRSGSPPPADGTAGAAAAGRSLRSSARNPNKRSRESEEQPALSVRP
jgi:hypothetical protein